MIGLSVSLCVRDIAEGKVKFEDVEKIIGSTCCKDSEAWAGSILVYRGLNWQESPGKCTAILIRLLDAGLIKQPRLEKDDHFPMLTNFDHWVKDESEIVWYDERP